MKLGLVLSALLLACNSPALRMPTSGVDATCGASEVQCAEQRGDVLVPTGTCCAQDFICGGAFPNVGCPTGQCCFVGPEMGEELGTDAAPRHVVPQRTMR